MSKSQPRFGDQGARGRRIVEDDLALEPVDKRLKDIAKPVVLPVLWGHHIDRKAFTAAKSGVRGAERKLRQAKVATHRRLEKRDYNPEDRRQRRLGAAGAGLTILAGGLGYKGVKGAAKTTSRLKALGIRGAVGAKDTTVGAKSRPFLAVDREAGMYLGGAGAAAGGALGLRQHAEKKRGRPWD